MDKELDFDLLCNLGNISKELTTVRNIFTSYLNEKYDIKDKYNTLISYPKKYIIHVLKDLDINTVSDIQVSRITMLFSILSNNELLDLKKYISENYKVKIFEPKTINQVNKLTMTDIEIKEHNKKVNEILKNNILEEKKIKQFNIKLNTILEYLNNHSFVDLMGDETYNVDNKPYIYFKLFNTLQEDIITFIKNIHRKHFENHSYIKRIVIVDVSDKYPSSILSAVEIRLIFENDEHAIMFNNTHKIELTSLYEQFVLRIKYMRKLGGEFGLWNERKDNNVSPDNDYDNVYEHLDDDFEFSDFENEEIDETWYAENLCIDLSECVYYNKDAEFHIIPKEFYNNYSADLENEHLEIIGITDNPKWKRINKFYFCYIGDNPKKYLEDNNCSEIEYDIYNAKDLYFNVSDSYEGLIAYIVPKHYWNKHNCLDDSIGNHNVNNIDLIKGGCSSCELMEGIFGCNVPNILLEEFKQKMISAGFEYCDEIETDYFQD